MLYTSINILTFITDAIFLSQCVVLNNLNVCSQIQTYRIKKETTFQIPVYILLINNIP